MNFLCDINHSFADLLTNYLKLIKERSSCSEVFCKNGALRNFAKFLRTPFFKEYLWWLHLKEEMQTKLPPCVLAVGKENMSGEA